MFNKEFTGPKDAPKVEEMTQDGVTIKFERDDPYYLIYMDAGDVELPPKYQGKYTNIEYARADAMRYFADRKAATEEIKSDTKKKKVA